MDSKAKGAEKGPEEETDLAQVRADLEKLKDDLALLMDAMGRKAQRRVRHATDTAEVAAAGMGDWAEDQYAALRETIRAQPITACALAAGFGLLLGQMLRR